MSTYIEELARLANITVGDFTLEGWYKTPPKPKYKMAAVTRSVDGYSFYIDGFKVPYQQYATVFDAIAYEAFSHLAKVPVPPPFAIEIEELRLSKIIREAYKKETTCTENSSHLKVVTGVGKPPLLVSSQNN